MRAKKSETETQQQTVYPSGDTLGANTIQGILGNVSSFTRAILHRLTTPYASLVGYTNLLTERIQDYPEALADEDVQTFLKGIAVSQENFDSFIGKLRLFSDPFIPSLMPTSLSEFIESIIEDKILREKAEACKRKISFTSKVKPGQDLAPVDASYLSMAIRSVLEAVVTAPGGKGVLRCRLDRTLSPEPPFLWEASSALGAPSEKGYLRLKIEDKSGAWQGMDLSQLFIPFQGPLDRSFHRIDRLDLPIAYQIVRAHQGFFRLTETRDHAVWLLMYLPE